MGVRLTEGLDWKYYGNLNALVHLFLVSNRSIVNEIFLQLFFVCLLLLLLLLLLFDLVLFCFLVLLLDFFVLFMFLFLFSVFCFLYSFLFFEMSITLSSN